MRRFQSRNFFNFCDDRTSIFSCEACQECSSKQNGDDYLSNSMVVYIERELFEDIDPNSIIDEFNWIKNRRARARDKKTYHVFYM
ncbi:hypothetical protein ACS0TY_011726 [Phlomoides rotata]